MREIYRYPYAKRANLRISYRFKRLFSLEKTRDLKLRSDGGTYVIEHWHLKSPKIFPQKILDEQIYATY